MCKQISRVVRAAATAALVLGLSCGGAQAAFTLINTYHGGISTWSGNGPAIGKYTYHGKKVTIYDSATVGDPKLYSVPSLTADRVGDDLLITINTPFAGHADSLVGYGSLFITPGVNAWSPKGVAPYPLDQYEPGDWTYAVMIPKNPGKGARSGAGAVYKTSGGKIVMSGINGNTVTAPFWGGSSNYFRQGEAVQFTPGYHQKSLFSDNWYVDPKADTIKFVIHDNGYFGNDFAVSWAMTCANGIIQGQVSLAPEPAVWGMLLIGFAMVGLMLRGARKPAMRTA